MIECVKKVPRNLGAQGRFVKTYELLVIFSVPWIHWRHSKFALFEFNLRRIIHPLSSFTNYSARAFSNNKLPWNNNSARIQSTDKRSLVKLSLRGPPALHFSRKEDISASYRLCRTHAHALRFIETQSDRVNVKFLIVRARERERNTLYIYILWKRP